MYRHLRKYRCLYTIACGTLNVVMIYLLRLADVAKYDIEDAISASFYGVIVGVIFFFVMTKYYLNELDRREIEGK